MHSIGLFYYILGLPTISISTYSMQGPVLVLLMEGQRVQLQLALGEESHPKDLD